MDRHYFETQRHYFANVRNVGAVTGRVYNEKPLKEYCKNTGLCWDRVYLENYGFINTFPEEAWKNVYGVDILPVDD